MDKNNMVIPKETIQDKILYLIKENSQITQKMISKKLGVARSTISLNIQKMKDREVIKRIGSDRNGHWKIL